MAVKTAIDSGPASRALDGHPPETKAAVAESLRTDLAPFMQGNKLPLGGSIWIVTAVNP